MYSINEEEALNILLLKKNYTEKELKKSYYKNALLYHPDKNPGQEELFKKINESYQLLNHKLNNKHYDNNTSKLQSNYSSIFKDFIYNYFNDFINNNCKNNISKNNNNIIYELIKIITNINNNEQNILLDKLKKFFISLNNEDILKNISIIKQIINFFIKNKELFESNNEIIYNIIEILNNKCITNTNKIKEINDEIIFIKPSLYDIYNEKIYIYDIENKQNNSENNNIQDRYIYIPLWLDEIEIDKQISNDKNKISKHFVIHIQPILPKNVLIDENNNINIYKYYTSKELIKREIIELNELKKENSNEILNIKINNLFIKKYQTIIFEKKGIPIINDTNIYDNSNKSNIIVHIFIEY